MLQAEISNREIKASWKRLCNRLEDALWAHKTAYKAPIGISPYLVVFVKECHIPLEGEHQAY